MALRLWVGFGCCTESYLWGQHNLLRMWGRWLFTGMGWHGRILNPEAYALQRRIVCLARFFSLYARIVKQVFVWPSGSSKTVVAFIHERLHEAYTAAK
eukprot:scaffold105994_cov19-Prasinocladus_malaysianus.AAC.1